MRVSFPKEVECNAEKYSIVVADNYENFQNILPVERGDSSLVFLQVGTSYKSGMILVINNEKAVYNQ